MENNKEDKIMKTDIKNYINQFWRIPFYGGKEDLEVGGYKIHIIQNMFDYKITDLIIYLYKGNNYVDGLRWDIKKRQTNKVVEEISLNIK